MDISCFFQNKPMSGLPGTLTQIFLHLIIIRVTGLLLLLGADQSFLLYLKSQSLLNTCYRKLCFIEISSSSLISGSLHFSIPILWLLLLHKRERRRGYKGLLLLSGLMLFAPVEVKYQELNYHGFKLVSAFNLFLLSISQVKDILKIHFCIQRN